MTVGLGRGTSVPLIPGFLVVGIDSKIDSRIVLRHLDLLLVHHLAQYLQFILFYSLLIF